MQKLIGDEHQDKLNALERITQYSSHSENIDGFVGFGPPSEALRDTAKTLLSVIELADAAHYKGMCKMKN